MTVEAPIWSINLSDVSDRIMSSNQGLSSQEARRRLAQHGKNEIVRKVQKHGLTIFLYQFVNPLILILIGAAIIAFFLHEELDAIVILGIVLCNSILGFIQEYKAEKALRTLRGYVTSTVQVLRDGEAVEVDTTHLVIGDVVFLHIGDVVPADMRIMELHEFSVDESSLTGESVPVEKSNSIVSAKYSLPQQLSNMVFMGTVVSSGTAKCMVTSVGGKTFLGSTARMLNSEHVQGEFHRGILSFSNFLLKVTLIMTLLVFAANALLGRGIITSFLFALALAVGITPEVLPIIVTVTLSAGALQMAREKVITKRLASIEDLGNMDVLCCDKTGTLTEGKMSLQSYVGLDGRPNKDVLLYGLLCNSINDQRHKPSFENPIDRAIWDSRAAKKLRKDMGIYAVLDENEFDFERRRMSVLIQKNGRRLLLVKGGAEAVLHACRLPHIEKDRLLRMIQKYEEDGYISIAVARKTMVKMTCCKSDESSLDMLGFLLFHDPPKKTVKESLERLHNLGVSVRVISGDSPIVTRKVCQEVGLAISEDRIVTGDELSRLNDDAFIDHCLRYNIFSRVSPEQKHRIVRSLQEKGYVVGFLGDGINDAPAMHQADVGISVNTATPVAKDAADIILLQKSLGSIAHGVEGGRKTFANINKYIFNTISANFGNMITVAAASLFLTFIPLLPSQILLANFMSDFPLLTLYRDNVDSVSIRKPKHWNIKVIGHFMYWFGALSSIFDFIMIIALMLIFSATPGMLRTGWFLMSILSEIVITFAIRTRLPLHKSRPSRVLVISSLFTGLLSVWLVFTSFGRHLFQFESLPLNIGLFMAGVVLAYLLAAEIGKVFFFRRYEV